MLLLRVRDFPSTQVSNISLETVKKPRALCFCAVGLWLQVGERWPVPLCQPPRALREAPDCVGGVAWGWWGVAPTRLRGRSVRACRGKLGRSAPPLLQAGEETAESSPIGEPFISLFFTVINPSEHAASVAPGGEGRGEGEPRTGPGRKGGAPGFVAFRELCCHSNGAF